MWFVNPARDLTVMFLSVGYMEGLAHQQRLSKIIDLALAAYN